MRRVRTPGERKLHLGAFDKPVEGWLNTDITGHLVIARLPGAATVLHRAGVLSDERAAQHRAGIFRRLRYLDLARRFPFPDDTFDAVFSSHVLEHLSFDTARHCLQETRRVLAPGGVVRVVVPDLDRMIADYDPQQADSWAAAAFEARQAKDKNRHRWMYNETSLRDLLLGVGFDRAVRRSYREGTCPDLDLIDNRPESLFMEAFKG